MALDAETIKFLEEVKKGKPRRFVMICKGVKILSLIIYKKGTVEKYKKQAKQEGKGQFYHGVVDGKGLEIVFKLSAADGFEKPPGKELILKDFLATESGIKFKPAYEIVTDLPDVPEDDDELTAGAGPATTAAPSAEPSGPTGTGSAGPETGSATASGPASEEGLAAEFKSRLTGIVAQIKQASGPAADQAKEWVGEAVNISKTGNFEQAHARLAEVENLLGGAPSAEPSGPASDGAEMDWQQRFAAVEPEYLKALAGNAPNAEKLRVVMNFATAQAADGNFSKALAALGKLLPLLNESAAAADAPASEGPSLVVLQQARLAWDAARRKVEAELQRMEQAIVAKVKAHNQDETATTIYDLDELEEGMQFLKKTVDKIAQPLMDQLDKALNAEGAERNELNRQAKQLVEATRAELANDPQLSKIDANPFVNAEIRRQFDSTLNDLIAKF